MCWDTRCANSKWFHNVCVIAAERYWPSTYATICASFEEAIATLCDEKDNWRCDFCNRPLFFYVTQGWFDVIIYYLFTSCDVYIQIKWYLMCIFLSFTKCLWTRKYKTYSIPNSYLHQLPYVLLREREKMRVTQLLSVSESRHSAWTCSLRHARDTQVWTSLILLHNSTPTKVYPDGASSVEDIHLPILTKAQYRLAPITPPLSLSL